MALDFAKRHQTRFRYEGYRSRWFSWSGQRWEVDHKLMAYSLARRLARDTADSVLTAAIKSALHDLPATAVSKEKATARRLARRRARTAMRPLRSARTVHSIISLARSDERLSANIYQWDASPSLLNTPAGTIDLRSGSMQPHNPKDYITKICAVSPAWGRPAKWLDFLNKIFRGDAEMVSYMQRVLGYCLTGETGDHALFYSWGRGQNGKTTILETATHLLGDYGIESPPQAFIASNEVRHETEIARLHNVRLVMSDELPAGKEWDTSKVKRLTGGATVSARFMRQDYFEFKPQFKLLMAGNDKPSLRQVDDAIRRRFHLIPFEHKIHDHEKILNFGDRLIEAEGPLILGWMIEGSMMWYSGGLQTPRRVKEATEEYLSSEDSITSWFEECCIPDKQAFHTTTELFQSWASWAKANEEYIGSRKAFSQTLSGRALLLGLTKTANRKGKGFTGASIISRGGSDDNPNGLAPGKWHDLG